MGGVGGRGVVRYVPSSPCPARLAFRPASVALLREMAPLHPEGATTRRHREDASMGRRIIRTDIDDTDLLKGDVLIVKRTFVDRRGKLQTTCTKCGRLFPTTFRRMAPLFSKRSRACEVRNIPQCPFCRSAHHARAVTP